MLVLHEPEQGHAHPDPGMGQRDVGDDQAVIAVMAPAGFFTHQRHI